MSNDNTANMQTESIGNLTRLTIGTPSAPPVEPLREANRVAQGVHRLDMGQGRGVVTEGVTKYTVGQDRPTGSVMATRQNVNGAETVELVPGVPGSRTHIRFAVEGGLIQPLAPGVYRDVTPADYQGPAKSPNGAPTAAPEPVAPVDPGAGVFSEAEDAAWAEDIAPLPQPAYDAAAASVVASILQGKGNLDNAANQLAEQAGLTREQAADFVNEGTAMYERIVAKEVAALGIADKQEFYSWMRDTKGRGLQEAIQMLTERRDVSKFRQLATEFSTRPIAPIEPEWV